MRSRPFRKLITVEESLEIILKNVAPFEEAELVELASAPGRVLAKDIVSTADVPPFRRAGMDGFAVVAKDVFQASQQNPIKLQIIEEVYAGQMPQKVVEKGNCIRVATGAPMPDGADAVVMIENTEETEKSVKIFKPQYPGGDTSDAGSDIKAGQTALEKGVVLDPAKVGVLAALGITKVEVLRKPVVGIAPTGNEVVPPGKNLQPGRLYDVNTLSLSAVVTLNGAEPRTREIVDDTMDGLRDALKKMMDCDIIVFSGGSSVGERDLLIDLLAEQGEVLFHGVLVKPGKPTLFGLVGKKPFFGMPGYPTSCLSNAYLFIIPTLRKMLGLASNVRKEKALMGERYSSNLGRHQIVTVKLEDGIAHPVFKVSGAITSMAAADGFIEIPTDQELVDKGDEVEVLLL